MTFSVCIAGPIPGAANHWLANTGGRPDDHIANFLTDMVVYYPYPWQTPTGPLALTASFWDEGGCGYCAYKDGKQAGKAEWYRDTIHSDRAWFDGKKCRIENFWGRAFLGKNAPPPIGDSAPYVACDGHDDLRTVVDPTALAFDRAGHLLVADNGPDQNVKIFAMDRKQPRLLRMFGDPGGVFAGPVPGKVGARRFWGIRGLGVDSQGNVYVGNTGIPMQTMGGTDIRVFSGVDSSLLWRVQGLAFVNTADADPDSDARSVFLNAKRFEMDWDQPPGKSWRLAGVTLDPFRHPFDPRIVMPMETVFLRRLGGRLFQFATGMYADFIAIHRFEEGSEIAIPTGFICLRDANVAWVPDSLPDFERNESNKRVRWHWFDRDGDGIPQRSEFGLHELANIYSQSLDVADNGDIWLGGMGEWSTQFREGGALGIKFQGLDAAGLPRWAIDDPIHLDSPVPRDSGDAGQYKYLSALDAMFVGVRYDYYLRSIHRYDHWSDTARRVHTAVFDIGYDDLGASRRKLDSNTAAMTLPFGFTADSDYVYVGYLDRGRDARVRGEITIYDARDAKQVGWVAPGELTGNHSGTMDIPYPLNVRTRKDGRKVLFVEDDGFGKVNAYIWCPEGKTCPPRVDPPPPTPPLQRLKMRRGKKGIEIQAPEGARLEMRGVDGRIFWRGETSGLAAASTDSSWLQVPARSGDLVYAVLRHPENGRQDGAFFVP